MEFFDEAYRGRPPWDIGRPQPAIVELARSGALGGRVLDVGCGTGENTLFLASEGREAVGVDFAHNAIRLARAKAVARGVAVRFELRDAFDLADLGPPFDAAVDCGLFHVFSDTDRPRYARSLARVLRPGARLAILCFSEQEPADWGGPRRVTQRELEATFRGGWQSRGIRPTRFETNRPEIGGHAWLAQWDRGPDASGARSSHRRGSRSRPGPRARAPASKPARS